VGYAGTQCSVASCSSHVKMAGAVLQTISASETVCFYFQSVTLNSTGSEAAHFVTDIIGKELLGEESAESSELHREEVFDSWQTHKEAFSNRYNLSGHTSTSGRDTMSGCDSCSTSFTHERNDVPKLGERERHSSCDVCKKRFTNRNDLDNHTEVHNGRRQFSCEVCKKTFSQRFRLILHRRVHTGE
jgi:hypothetical protein